MELTFASCQLIHDTEDRSHSSPSFPSRYACLSCAKGIAPLTLIRPGSRLADSRLPIPPSLSSPNEKEISHGWVSWQTH